MSKVKVKVKKKPVMMLDEFQKRCKLTSAYPKEANIVYPLLGLCGELGEFAELLVKAIWPNEEECKGVLECNIYVCLQHMIKAAKDCEVLKKQIRDCKVFEQDMFETLERKVKKGLSNIDREELMAEMGDFASWYSNVLAHDLGFRFAEVLGKNLKKVERRKKEGKIHGSGSNR